MLTVERKKSQASKQKKTSLSKDLKATSTFLPRKSVQMKFRGNRHWSCTTSHYWVTNKLSNSSCSRTKKKKNTTHVTIRQETRRLELRSTTTHIPREPLKPSISHRSKSRLKNGRRSSMSFVILKKRMTAKRILNAPKTVRTPELNRRAQIRVPSSS